MSITPYPLLNLALFIVYYFAIGHVASKLSLWLTQSASDFYRITSRFMGVVLNFLIAMVFIAVYFTFEYAYDLIIYLAQG